MQKTTSVRLFSVLVTVFMLLFSIPFTNVTAATVITENDVGKDGTYDYELWKDTGTTSMTLNGNGKFSCEWSNINNCLFREGKKYTTPVNYKSLGDVEIKYGVDYQPDGNSYMCVYGWSKNPLVEYYIVETWGSWRPPGQAENKGTVTVNGGTYDIYKTTRVDQPSIEGNKTFDQYWSVRKEKPKENGTKIEGIISVSDHFAAWEKAGLPALGNLTEIALNIEGYQSRGKANVYENILKIGGRFDGSETPSTIEDKPLDPDANGYYFNDTFESGAGNWTTRGNDKVEVTSSAKHSGSKSMSVTGRTDSWNGAGMELDTATFKPGQSFSFSTYVMQDAVDSDDFKLSLQYDLNGEANYDTIAEAKGAKGKWVQLANSSYTIPSGASGLILYVETDKSKNSFYFDDAIVAANGTKIANDSQSSDPVTPTTGTLAGDVDGNGTVNANDVKALTSFLTKKNKNVNLANADVNGDGRINIFDLVALKKTLSKGSSGNTDPGQTQPTQPSAGSSLTPTAYMDNVRKNVTTSVPGSATASTNDAQVNRVTYFSKKANKNKSALVWTPPGYSTGKKYPVVYVNHGIMGSAEGMQQVVPVASNLVKSGEAEEMIVVLTNMYTNPYKDNCSGITADETKYYDDFLEDIADSLMPCIEQNYSVKTGRENTAITGFSMGGRESLYIGISRPDLFGFIGAACPAPGIVPAKDNFMDHPGNMSESEFKVKDNNNQPYLIMIAGGTNDGVVGTFPQQYHNLFTRNGQDHVWIEIQGGGHDDSVIIPLMYNFFRNIFKTGSQSSSGTVNPSTGNNTPSSGSTAGFFKSTFESGTDGWAKRGDTTLTLDSANYYSGSKSLKVTGRGDSWQGAAYELDTATYVPGNTYSFSTAVMQTSSSSVEMKLTLQYTLNGEDNFANVAKATAASCKWTKLENTAYTIPTGAKNLILYVESTESTTDYYIDEAVGAAKGTASTVTTGGGKVTATAAAATSSDGSVDISWIDRSKPMVAIAFDDGPDPNHNYAGRILDAIAKEGFHATFFYVGNNAKSSGGQAEIKKADSLGMEIANHTMTHTDLTKLSASQIRSEYDQCSDTIKSIIGRGTSKVMRPPYLSVNDTVKQALNDVALVNCKIDTGDWSGSSKDQIVQKITNAMNDGSLRNAVILCHETYDATASAIEYLAPYLKSKGWQIVTVSEMFAANGKQLKGGTVYNNC